MSADSTNCSASLGLIPMICVSLIDRQIVCEHLFSFLLLLFSFFLLLFSPVSEFDGVVFISAAVAGPVFYCYLMPLCFFFNVVAVVTV